MSRKSALRPLNDRLTLPQQARRAEHLMARRTVATQLMQAARYAVQQARYAVQQSRQMQQRGFWGRMKLVLLGK